MPTTCIRNAAWIIAWDASTARHAYLQNADLVFQADRISFIGRLYSGPIDNEIDGANLMVMPGLVNIHAHPSTEPLFRGVREEHGLTLPAASTPPPSHLPLSAPRLRHLPAPQPPSGPTAPAGTAC